MKVFDLEDETRHLDWEGVPMCGAEPEGAFIVDEGYVDCQECLRLSSRYTGGSAALVAGGKWCEQ